jgi:membrane-anchored glycerophosphoryl diester phosphodiesterase (GDPDase)
MHGYVALKISVNFYIYYNASLLLITSKKNLEIQSKDVSQLFRHLFRFTKK